MTEASGHVDVGGLKIAYRRAGSGPPVVLLHGGITDSREWSGQLEQLSDRFALYAWDAPGCGASDDADERSFRLPDYADVLAGFIEQLGIDRPVVVGLSFGSGLALQFYERHPHLTTALVLVSPYAGWAGSLTPGEVEARLAQAYRESDLPAEDFIPGWLPGLLTANAPSGLAEELTAIMADFHPAGYRMMARSFAEADLRDVLPTIETPLLVVAGEQDVRSPVAVAQRLAADAPHSEFVVLPATGHMCNMESPAAFNAALVAFLERLPSSGSRWS